MAKSKGAKVWVTASSGKHEACLKLGADQCIDYKAEDFAAFIQKEHPQKGVNLIVDPNCHTEPACNERSRTIEVFSKSHTRF